MTLPDFTAILESVHRNANPWPPRPAITLRLRPRLHSPRYASVAEIDRRTRRMASVGPVVTTWGTR